MDGTEFMDEPRIQGLHLESFWIRAISETIDSTEVLDQSVLQDYRDWVSAPTSESRMIRQLCESREYGRVWERLSRRLQLSDSVQMLSFCDNIHTRILEFQGRNASDRSHGFEIAWQYSRARIPQSDQNVGWMVAQLCRASSVSIRFVAAIWHYWVEGDDSILPPSTKVEVRSSMITCLRNTLVSGAEVNRVVAADAESELFHLVNSSYGRDANASRVEGWEWLGPVMIQALEFRNVTVALAICRIIVTRVGDQPIAPVQVDPAVVNAFLGSHVLSGMNRIELMAANMRESDREFALAVVNSVRASVTSAPSQ